MKRHKTETYTITAVANIVVPQRSILTLTDDRILASDTTEYFGNLIFENGRLARILFSSGYVSCSDNTPEHFTFHYYVKDHLGNNRAVVSESGAIEQSTHYYPFGNSFADAGKNPSLQPYKYNGKELDRMHGLDRYDYGARSYDPVLLQWTGVDQLCENYYPVSPYTYCLNNPVMHVDKEGKKVYLYATALPDAKINIPYATHTFLVVAKPNEKPERFSYGSIYGGLKGSVSGTLTRMLYNDDKKAVLQGKKGGSVKAVIPIEPPEGMTEEDFDNAVINAANQFKGNQEITYHLYPTTETTGNCNTSSTTLLYKAGVSLDRLNTIEGKIPGIHWGFGEIKPWTKEERISAKYEEDKAKKKEIMMYYESFENMWLWKY